MKQKEKTEAQEHRLEELELKVEEIEALIEEVSEAAYDKAVEVVTDKVREQTQLEDIKVIENYQRSVTSPKANNSPQVVKLSNTLLNRVKEKLKEAAGKVLSRVQDVLQKPEVREAGKEQIKEKARESIKDRLARGKIRADEENRARWERRGMDSSARKNGRDL